MIHVIVAVFALLGTVWALAIWLVGGFSIALGSLTIQAHDPVRPLMLGAIAATIYVVTRGPLNPRYVSMPLAILLSLCPAAAGIARNSWTAGGADQYAYVSQADLWLQRDLTVPVPLAAAAPWPDAILTFMPHGFRPAIALSALVPVTAPGLPLLMAGAKSVAGHCAMFLVTPLSGALLVWITFAMGRRLDSDALGLSAAWLMATSPVMLAMLVSPMSDVPAAALWALATYFALGRLPRHSVRAGLSASAAILIRPNLAPLAGVLIAWKLLGGWRPAVLLAAGTLPGTLFIAWINNALYGSPLASGYGSLDALFSLSHIPVNLARYGRWLVESQTPLALVGLAALLVPMKKIWLTREQQQIAHMLGATVVVVWALYLAYTPFEAWWFLRFLLPAWPAMCLGAAAVLLRMARAPARTIRSAAVAILLLVGAHDLYYAATHGAFPSGEGDHRYVSIAKMVEQATDPSAVIFAGQHSGPIRYYAGRTTIRFDLLDPAWLDRAVHWLDAGRRRPYFLLEDWEIPAFQERFSGSNALGTLALSPIIDYRAPGVPGRAFLFDPMRPEGGDLITGPPPSARATCVGPSPLLHLR